MPTLGGERLIEVLRAQSRVPRVVVYAHAEGSDTPRRAMAAGAAGFCSRSDPPERLLDVVSNVANGQMVFPFLDIRQLRRDPMDTLTKRERALLDLLARGMSNRDIAKALEISINTVKFHLRNLFEKLSVNSRAQAIALYFTSVTGYRMADGDGANES